MLKLEIALIVVAGVVCGLSLGLILGILLGKVGSLEILALIIKTPLILIRSPRKIRERWKVWSEQRILRSLERKERKKKVATLKDKIKGLKKEIRGLGTQMRRVKWLGREPKETKE